MARTCRLERDGAAAAATWSLADDALVVSPEGGAPEAWPLDEIAGIGGDEYAIRLRRGDGTAVLSKLGAEGGTLLAALRRAWLPCRARALRLAGAGEPLRFAAALSRAGGTARPAALLLFDDVLLAAAEGDDVEPCFLALTATVRLDETALAIHLPAWDGGEVVLSKLGGQTRECAEALAARRARLAQEAAQVTARMLPTLPVAARAALAAHWLPGRALSRAELEALCPGFAAAFAASWLAAMPRRAYGEVLLSLADPARVFALYARPGTSLPADDAGAAEAGEAEAGEAAVVPAVEGDVPVTWLLVADGPRACLEAVSERDWATYRFAAGPGLPGLVSQLACAPQFSREALYLPLEQLVADRHDMAVAARELPFLGALRAAFAGRVIHHGMERWRSALTAP